ncbi:MAG: TIGR03936 family radical SAM-associated protein, partial [Deltaproteobacteria bacterium]|nr:TIGR03936 family radical SAM-associated protein [Deltaproteobacteria bacterium]
WLGDYNIIKDWAHAKAPKAELFALLAGRPGVYIPALFEPYYEKGQYAGSWARQKGYETVPKATVVKLAGAPFPDCQIVPWVRPVHDRVVVEIARGCARGCRFCQAGYLYRPVRERNQEEILSLAEKNLKATGYDEAAFLSLSAGDHTQIEPLCAGFMERFAPEGVALSLPSLRVKSLSAGLAKQIAKTRKTGFTIAPEAASQRLREVINKDLTDEDLFAACQTAFSLGWRTLKLYFMTGLPTETPEDLAALSVLAQKVKKMGRAQINLSAATFIPKPHTPFQWQKASSLEEIEKRQKILAATKKPGLDIRYSSAEAAIIEAILARGDRRLGGVIETVWRKGARFEAWNENLKPDLWFTALASHGFELADLLAEKDPDGPLPWERIGPFASRDFLLQELGRAEKGLTTPDCRSGGCQGCGACSVAKMDLAATPPTTTPELATPEIEHSTTASAENSLDFGLNSSLVSGHVSPNAPQLSKNLEKFPKIQPPNPIYSDLGQRVLVEYTKTGPMSLLGHLEMVDVIKKAFRRSGWPLAYSQGFHPQPKISFYGALPLGLESLSELMLATLSSPKPLNSLRDTLVFPAGLDILRIQFLPAQAPKIKVASISYLIEADKDLFTGQPLHSVPLLSYTDNKGKFRAFDLPALIQEARPQNRSLILTIKDCPTGSPKPLAVARALYGLNDEPLKIKKIATNLV